MVRKLTLDEGFKCASANGSRLQMAASFHTEFDLLGELICCVTSGNKEHFKPKKKKRFTLNALCF